jgi:hypothetical protein
LNTSAHLYILYRSCTIYSEPCRTSLGYHKISTSSAVGCVTPEVRSRILAQASDGSSEFIHHCPETHGQRHTQAEFNVAPDNNYPLRFATGRHVWRFTRASIHCFVSSSLSSFVFEAQRVLFLFYTQSFSQVQHQNGLVHALVRLIQRVFSF